MRVLINTNVKEQKEPKGKLPGNYIRVLKTKSLQKIYDLKQKC
jgi:hypothetical protein